MHRTFVWGDGFETIFYQNVYQKKGQCLIVGLTVWRILMTFTQNRLPGSRTLLIWPKTLLRNIGAVQGVSLCAVDSPRTPLTVCQNPRWSNSYRLSWLFHKSVGLCIWLSPVQFVCLLSRLAAARCDTLYQNQHTPLSVCPIYSEFALFINAVPIPSGVCSSFLFWLFFLVQGYFGKCEFH